MADYEDVRVARRITRIINGPDFTLINFMLFTLLGSIVIAGIVSIFK